MNAGDCYLAETGMNRDGEILRHLFIVLLDPEGNTRNTITVPCSTLRSRSHDTTCVLNVGEHEFITGPTYVKFGLAEIECLDDIGRRIKEGRAGPKPPVGPDVLARVRQGLLKSPHTRIAVKEWFFQRMANGLT